MVPSCPGDRSIQEKDFGRMDKVIEMGKWAENIKTVQDQRTHIRQIISFVLNSSNLPTVLPYVIQEFRLRNASVTMAFTSDF
jgi:hypothetical protein